MHLRTRHSALALIAVATVVACDKPAVEWNEPVPIGEVRGPSRLTVDSSGHTTFVIDSVRDSTAPASPGLCMTSLRTVPSPARLYSAWWNVRPDSSSALLIASSADSGRTWTQPMPLDTTDIASTGCHRPPPSVATVGDDLYVAYSMAAPEGQGVFFAHLMGGMVHAPVAVIYGDRLVPTAIATDGNDVAVAYQSPNGSREQIGVAFSAQQGHLFAWRTMASRDVDVATHPAVALAGNMLAVSWVTGVSSDSAASRVVRVGRVQ